MRELGLEPCAGKQAVFGTDYSRPCRSLLVQLRERPEVTAMVVAMAGEQPVCQLLPAGPGVRSLSGCRFMTHHLPHRADHHRGRHAIPGASTEPPARLRRHSATRAGCRMLLSA